MEQLAWIVRTQMRVADVEFKPPVVVRIDGMFENKRSTPDVHNLRKVVDDAVSEGLGIDDRHFVTACGQPQVGKLSRIIITISQGV